MTETYRYREDWNCVLLRPSGDYNADEYHRLATALKADARVQPNYLRLTDMRSADMLPSPDRARTIAGIMSELETAKPTGRVAILVKDEVQFGMLRLYQAYVDDAQDRIHVVRTLADALAWLGLPADAPDPFEVWQPDWSSSRT